jgi:phytoene desaturase
MMQSRVDDETNGATAIVVGGGLGGMAAALRLRAKGWRVTLFDRALMLGGRAQVFEKDGFRHDARPSSPPRF